MLRRATALKRRTGTFSSPKLIVPLQIALAILSAFLHPGSSLPGFFQPNAPAAIEAGLREPSCANAKSWFLSDASRPKGTTRCEMIRPVLFELGDVGLDRGGKTVLDSLGARIPEGATAIVGPSGAGKSTLLRLLNRLADPDRGEIAYRDRPIRSYEPLALRREVALVPQLPALLAGTVESNLRYAADLAGEALEPGRSLALAGLDPSFA